MDRPADAAVRLWVPALLAMPLGVDVWERHPVIPVVAAPESLLTELERGRLARVERLATAERYEEEMTDRPTTGDTG